MNCVKKTCPIVSRKLAFHLLFFAVSITGFCGNETDQILRLAKLRQLDKAQLALDKIKSQSSKDFDGEIHFLQGVIHFELYQFNKALKELGEAREILESLPPSEYLGHCYLYLARLYKDGFANSEHARFLLNKAMTVYNQLPNREVNIANVNFQMARTFPFSDLDKRTFYNGLAMSYFESKQANYSVELAECYNLNALIFFFQDPKSETWKNEFLKAINLIKDKDPSLQINLGKYYDNFGYSLSRTADSQGLLYLQKGLTANKNFKFNGYWVTSSLNNIGSHFQRVGKPELSLKLYRDVVELRRNIFGENAPEVASGYEHIANTFRELGRIDSALFYFNRSIDTYRNRSDSSNSHLSSQYSLSYAFALKRRAEVLQTEFEISRKKELLILALQDLLEGSKIIQENYSSFELESSKIAYLADVRSLFIKRIEIDQILFKETNEDRYVIDGLQSMEFLRYASTFENQIRVRDSYSSPVLTKQISRQLELKNELILLKGLEDNTNVRGKIVEVSDQLFKVSDSIRNDLAFKQNDRNDLQEILQIELENENTIIEYQDAGESFYVICITKNQKTFTKILKPDEWDERLEDFFHLVSKAPDLKTFDNDLKTFVNNSHFLYQILLEPFENLLLTNSRLLIIPDGQINNLPFEVLLTTGENSNSYNNLKYLFRQFEIENSLSLHLHSASNQKKAFGKVLAFGYTEGPSSIPGAEKELASIARNFEVTARKGSESSSQYFINVAADFPLIHLAIHGQADEANLLKSRLIFSEKDTLFSHQLYSIRLNSPLVVLSSCETAVGKLHIGEGIFSMGRSFLVAGASSLIVTLWKTPDNSATAIFERFYELLAQGNNSSASIQKAKLNYLDEADKINAHPYFWAGIRPVGTFLVKSNHALRNWVLISVFGVFLLILLRKTILASLV